MDTLTSIPFFAMLVSLLAMIIQLIFGVLGYRRARAETDRQIAETKKQEALLALKTEEDYKRDVRDWGLSVLDIMAQAQQLTTIDPTSLVNSDFDIERARCVAALRSLLNRARWLFPNLAIPSRTDENFSYNSQQHHSALETILYSYHALETLDAKTASRREQVNQRISNLRQNFIQEMRLAVDPQVRGEDIERLVAELHEDQQSQPPKELSQPKHPNNEEEE